MKTRLIVEKADWPTFELGAPLQQTWTYGAALRAMRREVLRVELGEGQGYAQVIVRRMRAMLTLGALLRGPIWTQPVSPDAMLSALNALRSSLAPCGVTFVFAAPETDLPALLPLYTPSSMAELPLGAAAVMRSRLRRKWRNRLLKAEASRLRVEITRDPDGLVALMRRDQEQQKAKGFRALPPAFIANWVREAPMAFRIFQAWLGSELLAELLFLDHAPRVTCQIGWTGAAGRVFCAHHLLLWRAMQHFAEQGCVQMDLGLVDTVTAPGLARFKLGAGAHVTTLGPSGLILPTWPGQRWQNRSPFGRAAI